jgi:hypothetical protein
LNFELVFLHLGFRYLFDGDESAGLAVISLEYFSKRALSDELSQSVVIAEFYLFTSLLELAHPYLSHGVIREVNLPLADVTQSHLNWVVRFFRRVGD